MISCKCMFRLAKKQKKNAIDYQLSLNLCIGCDLTHKEIKDCLQLHLHESFKFMILLTWGLFEVSFSNETEVVTTQKLTTVKWNEFIFSFSKWQTHFN